MANDVKIFRGAKSSCFPKMKVSFLKNFYYELPTAFILRVEVEVEVFGVFSKGFLFLEALYWDHTTKNVAMSQGA